MRGQVIVVGSGPAGLMAAERLALAGHRVSIHDRLASPARKLLMAGRGGLNLTHSEPFERFLTRYGDAAAWLAPWLRRFDPAATVAWAEGLGQTTFVGSSGRVFPRAMKASPLLRAWLARLDGLGARLVTGSRLIGIEGRTLTFEDSAGRRSTTADAAVLALGGASWPRLGTDGAWMPMLAAANVAVAPLAPANAGLLIAWSAELLARHEGTALKRIAIAHDGRAQRGEAVVTRTGLEGGAVYALAAAVREAIAAGRPGDITIDLRPDLDAVHIADRLARVPAKASLATRLRKATGLSLPALALLREGFPTGLPRDAGALAAAIKGVRLAVQGVAGLERAISTAGGVRREAVTDDLMLKAMPGVFVAGEMLDWEAPTGGYLLQACLATGAAAAAGVDRWLADTGVASAATMPSGG